MFYFILERPLTLIAIDISHSDVLIFGIAGRNQNW
jgi:hypothetical protein